MRKVLLSFWAPGFRCTWNATPSTIIARKLDIFIHALKVIRSSFDYLVPLAAYCDRARNVAFLLGRGGLVLSEDVSLNVDEFWSWLLRRDFVPTPKTRCPGWAIRTPMPLSRQIV